MGKKLTYTYCIDLDERGYFNAHVENSRGNTVIQWALPHWECVNCGNEPSGCTCDREQIDGECVENWDILSPDWGIMKHNRDVQGLGRHLRDVGIIPKNATLELSE